MLTGGTFVVRDVYSKNGIMRSHELIWTNDPGESKSVHKLFLDKQRGKPQISGVVLLWSPDTAFLVGDTFVFILEITQNIRRIISILSVQTNEFGSNIIIFSYRLKSN